MIKVLVNAASVTIGGGLQSFVSFAVEALKRQGQAFEWSLALSGAAHRELSGFVTLRDNIFIISAAPAKSPAARRELLQVEERLKPDAVFTFFGPAYVRFKALHLCGVADGWVTHPTRHAYASLGSLSKAIILALMRVYKAIWFRRADRWVVEAQVAKTGLTNILRLPHERIDIVPNNCGNHYLGADEPVRFPAPGDMVRILSFCSDYPHKDLRLIPYVAKDLEDLRPGIKFKFVVTLPHGCATLAAMVRAADRLGQTDKIENIGPVPVRDGPALYRYCDIAFVPSLMETFSANYPEAMAMKRPIVATDLSFARDVCGNAALYFRPKDPKSAASAILSLIDDPVLWMKLVEEGERVLASLPTAEKKYALYSDCILRLLAASTNQLKRSR